MINSVEIAYRKTAAANVNGMGLLIGLYDTLAGDLRRAAEAERRNDIENRCREVNHALLVIGFLEDWVERGSSGVLAEELKAFYKTLRRKLIEAQVRRSAEMFEEQMAATINIREIWQRLEPQGATTPGPEIEVLPPAQTAGYTDTWAKHLERRQLSWSA